MPLAISILLSVLSSAPTFMNLLVSIIAEVHAVEERIQGAPGADKSAIVQEKVASVAQAVGAESSHVQDLINQVVDVSKQFKVGAFAGGSDQATAQAGA